MGIENEQNTKNDLVQTNVSDDKSRNPVVNTVDVLPRKNSDESWHQTGPIDFHLSKKDTTKFQRLICHMKRFLYFIGPGIIVAIASIDPGNYSTGIQAGNLLKYKPLFAIFISTLVAFYAQCLTYRLGIITGQDLSRNCRIHYPRWLTYFLYIFAELSLVVCEVSEVVGSAIAFHILLKVPYWAGVLLTLIETFICMFLYRPHKSMKAVRIYELAIVAIVFIVMVGFCIILNKIPGKEDVEIIKGYVPSKDIFSKVGILQLVGIFGATVSPFSIYLGSGVVLNRLRDYDAKSGQYDQEKGQDMEHKEYRPSLAAIKSSWMYSVIELFVSLYSVGFFVNSAIVIVGGSLFYKLQDIDTADLVSIYQLFVSKVNIGVAKLFAVSLLVSGLISTYTVTMAGQMVMDGFLDWNIAPWKRRIISRSIVILPCMLIGLSKGREGLTQALNLTQVATAFVLPFSLIPLTHLCCCKRVMKVKILGNKTGTEEGDGSDYVYMPLNWFWTILSTLVIAFIIALVAILAATTYH